MTSEAESKKEFLDFIAEIEKEYPSLGIIKKHTYEGGMLSNANDPKSVDWIYTKVHRNNGNILPLSVVTKDPERIERFSSKPSFDEKLRNIKIEFQFLDGVTIDFANGLDAAKQQFSDIDKDSLQNASQQYQRSVIAAKASDAQNLIDKLQSESSDFTRIAKAQAATLNMPEEHHNKLIQSVSREASRLQKDVKSIFDLLDQLSTPSAEVSLSTKNKSADQRERN